MQISKRTKGKKKQVISIPKEVVIEILRRVPCHDLSENLKMVCMQWCSIIYSGSFAYSHIEQRLLKSSSFSQLEVVTCIVHDDKSSVTVSSLEWQNNYQNYQFQDLKTKHLYTVKDVLGQTSLPRPNIFMMRVNSVNGFVCFGSSFDARFHITNPVTKEYVTTPTNTFLGINGIANAVGFGFCPLSHEYKVVVLCYTDSDEIEPTIFTVGIDHSWRSLKHIPYRLCSNLETVAHIEGVLYWYSKTKNLVCFDVSKEEFVMIMVPIESLGECVSVADKGGKLCLININFDPICSLLIEVYVANNMNHDLSSLNSWKKEFNVIAPSIAYGLEIELLYAIIVTNEILVINLGDIDEEEFGFFAVATGRLLGVFSVPQYATAIPYVPSLVAIRHRLLLAPSSPAPTA